jgi:hypothetical protein
MGMVYQILTGSPDEGSHSQHEPLEVTPSDHEPTGSFYPQASVSTRGIILLSRLSECPGDNSHPQRELSPGARTRRHLACPLQRHAAQLSPSLLEGRQAVHRCPSEEGHVGFRETKDPALDLCSASAKGDSRPDASGRTSTKAVEDHR